MIVPPSARFRLYTQPRSYFEVLKGGGSEADVSALERALEGMFGVKHAICMPQGRVAVYFAIKHLVKPGQEVILSPYTIADVINMVICAGAKPVFADIERHTCNIDPSKIEALITKDTGAVMITHLHGLVSNAHLIQAICSQHGIPLIEDSAQAFGALEKGQRAGAIGDVGCVSFGMFKNINTFYGGALLTSDDDLAAAIRAELAELPKMSAVYILKRAMKGLVTDVVTHPLLFKAFTFWIFRYGCLHDVEAINKRVRTELDTSRKKSYPQSYAVRYTPAQARVGLQQLASVDKNNQARIERGQRYHQALSQIEGLIVPPFSNELSHIYTYYPVQCDEPERLVKCLMQHGCDIQVQHLKNCADLESFKDFYRDCPNARQTAGRVILLPTYPRYPLAEVDRNIRAIQSYFESKRLKSEGYESASPVQEQLKVA